MLLLVLFLVVGPVFSCETGVAHVSSLLSVPRSLMANADVALLHTYAAPTLARCMEECCTRTYGACSVASFKRNATTDNCMHFYCRPLNKCKFLSSNSTDTFSFSSEPPHPSSTSAAVSTKEAALEEDHQFAFKNDNTTVKPRKGVDEDRPLRDPHQHTSGVKPRKGVSGGDIPHSELIPASLFKSNVKARKGVEDLPTVDSTASRVLDMEEQHTASPVVDLEMMSALEKAFEDDARSVEGSPVTSASGTPVTGASGTTVVMPVTAFGGFETTSATTHFAEDSSSAYGLFPSVATPSLAPSSVATETLRVHSSFTRQFVSAAVEERIIATQTSSSWTVVVATTATVETSSGLGSFHERLIAKDSDVASDTVEEEETETDRRYKSSIHLVLSLVFGLLVLFAVLGVVAKRVYDGWLRRDYFRMNYLIDGRS